MAEHKIHVEVITDNADRKLDATKAETLQTEQQVKESTDRSKQMNALTRQQTLMVASQSWTIVQNSMRMMGISLSSGFSAMISLGLQTVQFMSSMAAMHALVPGGQVSAGLFAIQALAGSMAITATVVSQGQAMLDFAQTGQMLDNVKSNTESEYYL